MEISATDLAGPPESTTSTPVANNPTTSPPAATNATGNPDPLMRAVLASLGPAEIRSLLTRVLGVGNGASTPNDEGNENFTAAPPITSLRNRYPSIPTTYLKEILDNRFEPENIIKLSTSFSPTPRRRETVTLGTITLPTAERDRDLQDYRGGLPSLMQPFEIYGQILVHFAPPGVRLDLQEALADYRDLLYTLNRTNTFESLKYFHFIRKKKSRAHVGLCGKRGKRGKRANVLAQRNRHAHGGFQP
jgi:hypothetical protein